MRVLLLCLAVVAGLVPAGAQERLRPARYMPRDWAAFVAVHGGFSGHQVWTWDKTPAIILFRDGRIVWRDRKLARDTERCDPDRWREGRVPADAIRRLRSLAAQNEFFTLSPEPARPHRQEISDLPLTEVGLSFGRRTRVVNTDALYVYATMPSTDPLNRSAAEIAGAITALIPRESRTFSPPAIRVALYGGGPVGTAAAWPLQDRPVPVESSWGPYNYYEGEEAQQVIRTLAANAVVRVNGTGWYAAWAPAISIPEPTVRAGSLDLPDRPRHLSGPTPRVSSRPSFMLSGLGDTACALAWSPGGDRLAAASPSNNDSVRIWEMPSGRLHRVLEPVPIYHLRWIGAERLVLGSGTVFEWTPQRGWELTADFLHWWTNTLAVHPDGSRVASGLRLGAWKRGAKEPLWKDTSKEWVSSADWSPSGESLAVSGYGTTVRLVDANTGAELRQLRAGAGVTPEFPVPTVVSWRPDGQRLAVAGSATLDVTIWENAKWSSRRLRFSGPPLNALSWSPEGRYLAASGGNRLFVWDAESGKRRTLEAEAHLYAAAWSPDGKYLATGGSDGAVRVWSRKQVVP